MSGQVLGGRGSTSTQGSRTQEPPLVSIVVITFDRIGLLEQTMQYVRSKTRYAPLEYILCDDGSPRQIQDQLLGMGFDKVLLEHRNRGLGHNQNKGVRAAQGAYVFQLQDDWECVGPCDFLEAGVELLQERADVWLIRYYDRPIGVPGERHVTASGRVATIFRNQDLTKHGYQAYSDTPHLKRRDFHERFGNYLERVPMTVMEIAMNKAFASQSDAHVAFLDEYPNWRHLGANQSWNPSGRKAALRAKLLANPLTRWPFRFFLYIRGRKP